MAPILFQIVENFFVQIIIFLLTFNIINEKNIFSKHIILRKINSGKKKTFAPTKYIYILYQLTFIYNHLIKYSHSFILFYFKKL